MFSRGMAIEPLNYFVDTKTGTMEHKIIFATLDNCLRMNSNLGKECEYICWKYFIKS